jgi:hypothetical protein
LPRILGYLALVLAAGFALAGVLTLLDLTVPAAVQISASAQALWRLAAAGTLIMRAREAPSTAGFPSAVAVTQLADISTILGFLLASRACPGALAARHRPRAARPFSFPAERAGDTHLRGRRRRLVGAAAGARARRSRGCPPGA